MSAEATRPPGTVYVVDDDASLRKALTRLFKTAGVAVEAFDSAESFFTQPRLATPACLVLDLHMPGLDGLGVQKRLKVAGTDLPVVFITGHGDVGSSVRAMKDGAFDFIEKPFSNEQLLAVVEGALARARELWAADGERRALEQRLAELTPRERDVLLLVTRGMMNKVVAATLGISEKTVKAHRGHMMAKMRARSLAELVRIAQRARLID